jgi:hypothetical protein
MIQLWVSGAGTHAYNHSSLEDKDEEIHGLRPVSTEKVTENLS